MNISYLFFIHNIYVVLKEKNNTVADKTSKKYHKKFGIFPKVFKNATSSSPGKRMCSWSFVFVFNSWRALGERITIASKEKIKWVKKFRYKISLSEVGYGEK